MALAEDITMVMILSIVIGLIAGWYFKCQGCDKVKGCVTCHDGDQYERSVLNMSDGLVLECRVQVNGIGERYLLMHNPVINDNTLNEGDKVKVIIIKKD